MANGDEKNLWVKVNQIAERGCGLREVHDRDIQELKGETRHLWTAYEKEREDRTRSVDFESERRVGMFSKFVVLILGIMLTAIVANYFATSSAVEAAVEQAVSRAMAATPIRR